MSNTDRITVEMIVFDCRRVAQGHTRGGSLAHLMPWAQVADALELALCVPRLVKLVTQYREVLAMLDRRHDPVLRFPQSNHAELLADINNALSTVLDADKILGGK